MLSVQNLALSFGGNTLFEDTTFECRPKRRYAITGKNGAGKSSFLKVLSGECPPSEGTVNLPFQAKLAILKQDHFKYEEWRILDVVLAGKPALWKAMVKKESILDKDPITAEDGLHLAELEEIIAKHKGYTAESFAHILLSGLGIEQHKHFDHLSTLSGGFKLRVLLAQTLFQEPDVLLLDEPTNHLDITSIHWLEEYLKTEFAGILLFVSHDKHFINSVATDILDIDYNTIKRYVGNYDQFMVSKLETEEQKAKERKGQENKVSQLQDFVDRFGAKASKARQAKSKQKQIDRIDLTDVLVSNRRAPGFVFNMHRPSGRTVITVKHISKSYHHAQVLNNIGFECERGEKIAIIGANGLGKSTLLKIITDHLEPDSGEFAWGYETHLGYFAQDHHEQLKDSENTVLHWLEDHAPTRNRAKVRGVLGQMLFSGDDCKKKIANISGGEAGRLLFASLMINEPNVLILDEPTNHLDLEALDGLTQALTKYKGTLIFVSHDRDFVRNLATRIIVLTKHGLEDITATYDEYLDASGQDFLTREKSKKEAKKDKTHAKHRNPSGDSAVLSQTDTRKQELKIQEEIIALEAALETLNQAMAVADLHRVKTVEEIKALKQEKKHLEAAIAGKMKAWEALSGG